MEACSTYHWAEGSFSNPGPLEVGWSFGFELTSGSGSTYVYGYCDATYREGWGEAETVEFVRNSKFEPSPITHVSTRTSHGARWFVRRLYPYVRHHKGQG